MKFFLLQVLFLVCSYLVGTSNLYGQEKPIIQFDQIGQITGSQKNFLGSPSDIVIIDDQIFVADLMDLKIKVFSRNGDFIREMGGRGRGPGEFMHITTIWKDDDGENINVVDYLNGKVVKFTISGSLVKEKILGEGNIIWPRKIHPLSETKVLVLYQLPGGKDVLFHIWDNDFNINKRSFSLPANLLDGDKLKELNLALRVGSSLLLDSTIYYSPSFYEGKIYFRNLNSDDSWTSKQGVKLIGNSYESLSPNDELVNEDGVQIFDRRVMSPQGTYIYRLYNTTKALMVTKEGLIAHFVEIRKDNQKQQGIEIFDVYGNFIGYLSYFKQDIKEDHYTLVPEHPKAIDEDNRVYTISRKGKIPVIYIYQLKVEY